MIGLAEIARRIEAHLTRFEKAQPRDATPAKTLYWHSRAYRAGNRVAICYISYQVRSTLSKQEAVRYLSWLDAGNEGRHWEALRYKAA